MKKNIKFIMIAILIVCLTSCILALVFLKKESNKKICNDFEFSILAEEINMATNNNFLQSLDTNISQYIPVNISEEANHIFMHGEDLYSDYFIIVQNLNESDYFDLENYVKTNNKLYKEKQIKFGTYGEYTYAIYSKQYASIIEGIIRSYVYCN